jgi:peptidoglycan hydrolase-like protein with peptidoglycan-binding domain/ketosteroid isomerase-like protein
MRKFLITNYQFPILEIRNWKLEIGNLICLLCLLSSDGYAFSLGAIEVKSSFNENFTAEVTVNTDGESGLQVSIGSKDDYARLDIYRDKVVDAISLRVETADKNRAVVRLFSDRPINHPSFNLIIKATLDGGTILENYVLAIDFQKILSLNVPASDEKLKAEEKQSSDISRQPSAEEETKRVGSQKTEDRTESIESQPSIEGKGLEVQSPPTNEKIQIPVPAPKSSIWSFARNMKRGDRFEDVKNLQALLKFDASINTEGLVTGYFGTRTKSAIIRFQEKYASEILSPLGLKSGTGYVGPFTRAKLNTMSGSILLSKNMTEAPPVESLHPIEGFANGEIIRQKIIEWKKDWESEDLEKYISRYSKGFASGGYNLSTWKESKDKFNLRHSNIEITIENIQIKREKNLIIASFLQKFKSDKIDTRGRKMLYFEKEGDDWKIKNEKWNRDIPSVRHPYVIHISSFKERGTALKEVNYFRENGYSAYEVPFDISGKGVWYRVIMDRFASLYEAREFAKALTRDGRAAYAKEMELPYSIETGVFESHDEAFKEVSKLAEKGYSSYPLMVCSADKCSYQILIGAYTGAEHAGAMSEKLSKNGIQNKIIQP